MKNELIQFSQADLKSIPSLERVLRLFQTQLSKVSGETQKALAPDLGSLAKALAKDMSIQLSAVGSAPLNLQSLLPAIGTAIFIVGTHSERLTNFNPNNSSEGTAFFESDRKYIYINTSVGGSLTWVFAAGVSLGAEATLWVGLGSNDGGALFYATDTESLWIWDGSAWDEVASGAFPEVIDTVALTGQMADIPATMFVDSDVIGTYRANYYLETTSANPLAGDVVLQVAFTDDVGATTVNSATLPLTALGRTSGVFFIQVANTAGITYAVDITGAALGSGAIVTRGFLFGSPFIVTAGYMAAGGGPADYALYLSLERLS